MVGDGGEGLGPGEVFDATGWREGGSCGRHCWIKVERKFGYVRQIEMKNNSDKNRERDVFGLVNFLLAQKKKILSFFLYLSRQLLHIGFCFIFPKY